MKKMIKSVLKFGYFYSLVLLIQSTVSYAYIDPSTVTYLVQIVAAVFVAIGAACTVYRHKIVAFFKKDKTEDAVTKEDDTVEDENGVVDIQLDEE